MLEDVINKIKSLRTSKPTLRPPQGSGSVNLTATPEEVMNNIKFVSSAFAMVAGVLSADDDDVSPIMKSAIRDACSKYLQEGIDNKIGCAASIKQGFDALGLLDGGTNTND